MSDYPVRVTFPEDTRQNRLWGIPVLGVWIRSILVIPQAIVLMLLAFASLFVGMVSWAPVLISGRMAGWGYGVFGGILRLSLRVTAYTALLTGQYPPFGPGGAYPVDVVFDETERQNRLWGIPFLGIFVRSILLIPHFVVLWFIAIVAGFLIVFAWVPVLVTGRQAGVVMQVVGGFYRWYTRVSAYLFLLTGTYPPFRFDD